MKSASLPRLAVVFCAAFASLILPSRAHNLDTRATEISFAKDFLNTMSARASANQPLVQANDEFWMLLKTTPGPGTDTGVGGYQTFYVPDGMQVKDVAYVLPDLSDPRGFRAIPMKGQSPIAIGNGSISPKTTPELTGWSLPGVNGLGVNYDPVNASGADRGTLAGVYADTGVFFSTDPRTVHNSYGAAVSGGSAPMTNNSGDTVGEFYASNIANSSVNGVFGTMTLWDSYQLRAYGRSDSSPIIDPEDGRGNAPWGLANAVAGPQSGYAWEFDYPTYQSTSGTNAQKMRAAIKIGPWQRIKYPGSQISSDQPGLISNALGYAGIDASLMGVAPASLPGGITAVRFAIGQLELGRPEYAAVKVKINSLSGNADDSFPMYADAFGGDAGGTAGGKDHIWRYFDPTVVKLDIAVSLQKVASKKLVAPGETFYFDLTFINNGQTAIPNISLTDAIPTGLTFVSATPSASSSSGSTYVWNLGTVTPRSIKTVRLYVKATGSGTVFNTVIAKSGSTVVGVATDSVEISTRSLIIKSKSVTPSHAAPGSTVQYTMLVENIGTGPSGTPMVLRDYLPAGFTYQSFVSATLNGAAISSPTISVNSSNSALPVFTISQGIQRDKSLVIRFNALIGAGVTPGIYYNQYEIEYESKKLPPIPEAPVTVGGGRIGDFVWRDWDGDGVQDSGEEGIANVAVGLYGSDGITLLQTKTTDANGSYLFTGLTAGTYVVKVTAPSGYAQTYDPDSTVNNQTTVTLAAEQQVLTADFGYRPTGSGSIGDQVFEDLNKNGVLTSGEPGIPNVSVRLYENSNANGTIDAGDVLIATQVTNGSGVYNFTGLNTGLNYLVQVDTADTDISSYFTTLYGSAANTLTSSNPRAVASGFATYTLADFGFWRALPATIGDQVFVDNNQNGTYDAGDAPLGNVTVNLYAADGVTLVATTPTDVSGNYLFNSVAAGTYVVRVDTTDNDIPSGYSASVLSFNPTVAAGASFLTADFPFIAVFGKSVDLASAVPGNSLNYTMFPYWPGPSLLTNASVRDTVPAGTTFVSAGQGGALSGLTGSAAVNGSVAATAASSGSPVLTSVADNEIWSDQPATNYGTLDEMWIERTNTYRNRLLIRFDLSPPTIPANATISSAVMRLTKESGNNGNPDIAAHRLNVAWDETTSSWSNRLTGTTWSAAGAEGDYHPTAEATTSVTSNGNYNWTLTSLTQAWVNHSFANNGVIMRLPDEVTNGQHRFFTKEHATATNHPRLTVNWSVAAVTGTTTAITVTPSSVTDAGSGVNVNVSMTVTATAAVTNVIPGALTVIPGSNGATATLVSGPTNSPASIGAGGGSATFTWVYKVFKGTAEDQVRFSGNATGTGATFASATSNGVVVKDAAATSTAVWNLGSNSAAVNGSQTGASAITHVASSFASVRGGTSLSPSKPAGTSQNDVMIASVAFQNGSDVAVTVPSGWNLIRRTNSTNSHGLATYYKVAGSSEPSNYAFSISGGDRWSVGISSFRNVSTSTPIDAENGQANGSSATVTASAVTTTVGGTMLVGSFTTKEGAVSGNTFNAYSNSLTEAYDVNTQDGGGNEAGLGSAYAIFSGSGSTGIRTATAISAGINVGHLVALRPAPTASTTTATSVLPALVTDTGSGVNVTVTQTVTATGAVTNITPPTNLTVLGTNGANATKVSGPTGSGANIGAGGGSATFTWVYKVTAGSTPGQVTFAGTPTGTGATFAAATSNGIIVTQPLSMQVQVISPNPGVPLVNNVAQFYNGPTFLAEDNAITSLTGSIGDYVWADADADGVQDSGEFGIPGVTVRLFAADGVTQLATATTDSSGIYRFYGLAAGNYVVRYDDTTTPSGYFGSTPSSVSVSLAASQQFNNADFGLAPIPAGTGSIGDYVWIDADNDGVQNAGELPLANVTVNLERLINGNWTVVGTATTGSDGLYNFTGLSAASYRVTVDTASQISSPYAAGTFAIGSVMAPTFDRDGTGTPHVALVTLASNSTVVTNADFGYNWNGSIGDYVWWDDNLNGLQDEAPSRVINNARVQLYFDANDDNRLNLFDGDYEITRVFTNVNGGYLISNLPPGRYIVDVYEDSIEGAVIPTTTANLVVGLAGNQVITTADFGYAVQARVEANIFYDANSSGFNDGSEILLAGITVTLSGTDTLGNSVLRTTTSSSTGDVVFLVPEGTYTISYDTVGAASLHPSLTTQTTPTAFVFDAVAGDDGIRYFEFGLDDSGAIGDTIFADQNGDGSQQTSEPGLSGVTVNLYLDADGNGTINLGAGDQLIGTTVTDDIGFYQFSGLANTAGASKYFVQVVTSTISSSYQTTPTAYPAGALPLTSTYSTALTGGQVISTVDFGYPLVPAVYRTISGTVYYDNGAGGGVASDGLLNGTESGLAGTQVLVEIDSDSNGSYETSYTMPVNASGFYSVGGIPNGANVRITVLEATLPHDAFVQTGDPNGAPLSPVWTIPAISANASNINFGYIENLGSIAGTVVLGNGNDLADVGEPVVGGVTVTLRYAGDDTIPGTSDDVVTQTTTASNGTYSFANLYPGAYEVTTTVPSGENALADADAGNPNSINVTLGVGQNVLSRDFEYEDSMISGVVWNDQDADGSRELGEPLLDGVTVFLDLDNNGVHDVGEPTTVTNASGFYRFDGLASGTFDVRVTPATLPSGSLASHDLDGTATLHLATVTVVPNQDRTDVDFGYYQLGSISGTVLSDADDDGDGDAPIEGVLIRLLDSSGVAVLDGFGDPVTALTSVDGNYSFGNLAPGDYRVAQDQPTNYDSVSDTDGPNDNVIGNVTPITVTAGNNNGGNDFIEIKLGVISGYVLRDIDNNGSGDEALQGVLLNLWDGSGNPVLDDFGDPIRVASGADGYYSFTLVRTGNYQVFQSQPPGYVSVSDVDGANNNIIGDEIPIVMTPGLVVTDRDFVEMAYGYISGNVFADTDFDGNANEDAGIGNVTLRLLDAAGDPVLDTNGDPVTTVTDIYGQYFFGDIVPGDYRIAEDQPAGWASVGDTDGANNNVIGDETPVTVLPATVNKGNDFTEIELGSISGYVRVGADPLASVTLTLLDENGDPVDGDPDAPGIQPLTTVTDGNGYYVFNNVPAGSYQIAQTQPFGYTSFGDADGGDLDIVGDVTPIVILPGEASEENNFIETVDTCPDNWEEWKFQHPGETVDGNPDEDAYDNFAEFAFAMPYDSGTGSPWLGSTAWIIQPSTLAPGTLEGVFIRPKGASLNVIYTLQYAATLGDPIDWDVDEIPIDLTNASWVDNGDCTETVTIRDLEALTGLTGGTGVVRIKADLDEDPPTGTDHTSYTEVEGWKESGFALCCRTYNNPYLRETAFTGTVDTTGGVVGQALNFTTSAGTADLGVLLASGAYYLEVTDGDNAGHRFDIVSASGTTVTLASDSNLQSATEPFNTLLGPPPASLAGDRVVIRRHLALDDVFPPSGFGANNDRTMADQVQVFADGQWIIYWLYDDGVLPARWVKTGDNTYADQGKAVLAPGQGLFFNNRRGPISLLAYGEVRANDFIRPLAKGSSLVGGGYPLDQSATSRAMITGFYGSRDFATADSFFIWKGDEAIGVNGYQTYFLNNNAPRLPSVIKWAKIGDASLLPRDAEILFLGDRSVFIRSKNGLNTYTIPSPWSP